MLTEILSVTRSHKFNDRDHAGLADGTASIEEHLPRYFSKSGHEGVDPKKVKKEGSGKSNWGRPGEESDDYDFKFTNARRRSNSSSNGHGLSAFKTKFETNDQDPVFEEELHGAPAEEEHLALDKEESADSISSASIDEEDHAKKV
ncbi:hypothetical protein G7Y79_00024g056360 [Physcia stellaris]|nr:hypothetical protein G7Y79_00024g056360 [Physcia stellaris]